MRTVRLKSGGHVNIYGEGKKPVPGEINFSAKEWELAQKISKSTSEPDAEKEFWKTTIEKKLADENYSLFSDFPEIAPTPVTEERHHSFNGADICRAIISDLKGNRSA